MLLFQERFLTLDQLAFAMYDDLLSQNKEVIKRIKGLNSEDAKAIQNAYNYATASISNIDVRLEIAQLVRNYLKTGDILNTPKARDVLELPPDLKITQSNKISSIKIKGELYKIEYHKLDAFKKRMIELSEGIDTIDDWIAGAEYSNSKIILINIGSDRCQNAINEIIYHECMHALHSEYTGSPDVTYNEEDLVRLETAKRHDINIIYNQIYKGVIE